MLRTGSVILLLLAALSAPAATLQVGPGKRYSTPCKAIGAADDGDRIEIDGSVKYPKDTCVIRKSGLVLRGVNGRPVLDVTDAGIPNGKAIWVIAGKNTTVENIEFTGAWVPDGNGSGIRLEGANLTVRNCYFHHNQEGILTSPNASSEILIEYSEFYFNDDNKGYAHNMYIGDAASFTLRYSYVHDVRRANLVKSRARETNLFYNRIGNEDEGGGSWEVDLPNGGKAHVVGNVIHQNANAVNENLMSFGSEGFRYPENELYVVNNTFVNDGPSGAFLYLPDGKLPAKPVLLNNLVVGLGTVSTRPEEVTQGGNIKTDDRAFFRDPRHYDYRLRAGSPAVDAGTDRIPDAFVPKQQYVHGGCAEPRHRVGRIDVGAYEYEGAQTGSSSLVIGQLYPGGADGKGGFVELFNRSVKEVDIEGWSVQVNSGDGLPWTVVPLHGTIPAGHYYLVRLGEVASGASDVTADATGKVKLSADKGRATIVAATDALPAELPCSDALVDVVGYGGVTFAERLPVANLPSGRAATREMNGCTDSNDNAADFRNAAPAPRNSASPAHVCTAPAR